MLPALFCLRLALGMAGCLLLLSPASAFEPRPLVGPRYFRTHFLVLLGLTLGPLLLVRDTADWLTLLTLAVSVALAFVGSITWSLEKAPGGVAVIVLTTVVLLAGLGLLEADRLPQGPVTFGLGGAFLGSLTSAALLGAVVSAMLLGHSYLIAPSMSITPLFRLILAVVVALVLRMLVDGFALGRWTWEHSLDNLKGEEVLWLPVRWGVGFVAPLVLCWMTWQTARIRSTQSATGILYVVVIFCFLGELTGQLLRGAGVTL
jgi:hypothetical protein